MLAKHKRQFETVYDEILSSAENRGDTTISTSILIQETAVPTLTNMWRKRGWSLIKKKNGHSIIKFAAKNSPNKPKTKPMTDRLQATIKGVKKFLKTNPPTPFPMEDIFWYFEENNMATPSCPYVSYALKGNGYKMERLRVNGVQQNMWLKAK